MATLSLMLLGGFQVGSDTGAPITISAKKAKALLAYLALQPGQWVSRDRLAALLWEDSPQAQARTSLRGTLASLRKALPAAELLMAEGDRLAITPSGIDVDVLEFERLAAEATPVSLERAVGLYQGEFLEGFNPRAPAFEDWLMEQRARLREQALGAMTLLLDHHLSVQANERAIQLAIRLLSLDPLREPVHRTLMRLYARQHYYGAALKQYRTCQAVLRRELGLAPEPETEQLYRHILEGRRKPSSAVVAEGPRGSAGDLPDDERTITQGPELRQLAVVAVRVINPDGRARLRDIVMRNGASYRGVVIHSVEHGATVAFGLPTAHGNEVECALRAALDIRRTLAEAGGAAGIGIASGQALVGSRSGGEAPDYEVRGDVVNTAEQLAVQADPGGILITDAVYHASAGHVTAVRGLGERSIWRVPASGAWRQDMEPPALVGRWAERRQFMGAAEACLETGCGQAFLIRGEAGIGKTRLVTEFQSCAAPLGFVGHQAQVLDFGVASGQDAIAMLVRRLLDLPYAADAPIVALRTPAGLEPDQQALLNHLLDLPQPVALQAVIDAMDAAARRRGKQALVAQLVRSASQRSPRLLIVEDIHWADAETLEFLAQIALTVKDCPALLVMTTRVEGEPLDPHWRGAMQLTPLTTLDLSPLRPEEALALARALSGSESAFVCRCVERAGGNPLFLEQLLRSVGDDEAIPDSVQSIVWARLDRLAPVDKQAAQAAAVLGQRFTLAALRQLIERPDYRCDSLVRQRLIRPQDEDYGFVHALIMQGIYTSLPPLRRRELHRRAADWYRTRDPVLYAQHLDRAEDQAAAAAYLSAAQVQTQAYRYDRALELVQRGLLIVHEAETEYELTCLHGELLGEAGATAAAIDEFEHALSLAKEDSQRCRAWLGMAEGLIVQDRYEEALALLGEAETVTVRRPCPQVLAQIHCHRGNILFSLGHTEDCLREHELALAWARQAGVPALEARALSGLADAYYQRGRIRSAYAYYDRCITTCRAHGLGRIEMVNLAMRGLTRFYQNDLAIALEDCTTAAELSTRIGNQRSECVVRSILSLLFYYRADYAAAIEQAERGLALARRLGSKRFEAENLYNLGAARAGFGLRTEGERDLDQAYALCRETGGLSYTGSLILGSLAWITRDPEKRRWALREGEALLTKDSVSHNFMHFYQLAIDTALAGGEWDEAQRYAAALEDYTRAEPLPWSDFFIARGRTLASYHRGAPNPALIETLRQLCDEAEHCELYWAVPALKGVAYRRDACPRASSKGSPQ